MAPRLIDTHCHLDPAYFPAGPDDVVARAEAVGVGGFVVIGVGKDLAPARAAVALANAKPAKVAAVVGVHPHDASTLDDAALAELTLLAADPSVVAVGEIGLDYHYDHSPREIQLKQLDDQLEIALRTKLPVVIHAREAEDDLLAALTRYAARVPQGSIPGVIHCFSGTQAFGQACLDIGFYISFSGILTFKTAEDLRIAARAFPLDRLLVETDSPYLAPIPHRGKKCEPSMVRMTAQKLAEVKNLPIEEIAAATTTNSRLVFKLP